MKSCAFKSPFGANGLPSRNRQREELKFTKSATYINHLVKSRRSTDLEVFDTLMKGASREAREVLERFRDNHAFDPDKILPIELHIQLDQHFHPMKDLDLCSRAACLSGHSLNHRVIRTSKIRALFAARYDCRFEAGT